MARVRPVTREDGETVRVDLDLPADIETGARESKIEPADPRTHGSNRRRGAHRQRPFRARASSRSAFRRSAGVRSDP